MRQSKRLVVAVRGTGVVLIVVALAAEIQSEASQPRWSAVDFASHFTVLSNVFAASLWLVLLVPVLELRNRDALRGAAVVYMLTTAVVYNSLLSNSPTHMAWPTIVLHIVAPALVTIEWLIVPLVRRLSMRTAAWWLVFPAAYAIYTLARGRVTAWYPYDFLDPRPPHTYLLVGVYCLGLGAAIGVLGLAVTWLGSRAHPTV